MMTEDNVCKLGGAKYTSKDRKLCLKASRKQLQLSKPLKDTGDHARSHIKLKSDGLKQSFSNDTNYHYLFLDQIEVYKRDLRNELIGKLEESNEDNIEKLNVITNAFEKKCSNIGKAVQPLRRGLATERVTVSEGDNTSAIVTIEKQMTDFAKIKDEKYATLVSLWKEYEEVQIELIKCAVAILGPDDTNITEEVLPDPVANGTECDRPERPNQNIQLDQACEQHKRSQQNYIDASASLDERQEQLSALTHTMLKDNKALLQSFKTSRERQIDELKEFLENMGML